MTKEEKYFIQILRDHILGFETGMTEALDWEKMLALAQSHQVTGIVYAQCKEIIPDGVLPVFFQAYSVAFYFHANRRDITEQLLQELQGITAFSVKGLEVAKHYPVPALRTMGDCDIVVMPDEMEKTKEIMQKNGFVDLRETERDQEWHCEKDGINYELHGFLARVDELDSEEDVRFYNDFAPYVTDHQLDWSFHFLFLLNHLRRHIRKDGVGMRQFLDIAVIMQKIPELRWKWIAEKLGELNMMQFASCCFSLIENWFGICAPIEFERVDYGFQEQFTEWVLSNGVFGFDNELRNANQTNAMYQELTVEKGSKWLKRLKLLCREAFPTYHQLIQSSNYGFLKGKPFLLPLAWTKRIFFVLVGKKNKELKQVMSNVLLPTSEIEMKKAMYDKLGL